MSAAREALVKRFEGLAAEEVTTQRESTRIVFACSGSATTSPRFRVSLADARRRRRGADARRRRRPSSCGSVRQAALAAARCARTCSTSRDEFARALPPALLLARGAEAPRAARPLARDETRRGRAHRSARPPIAHAGDERDHAGDRGGGTTASTASIRVIAVQRGHRPRQRPASCDTGRCERDASAAPAQLNDPARLEIDVRGGTAGRRQRRADDARRS